MKKTNNKGLKPLAPIPDKGFQPLAPTCKHETTERIPGVTDTGRRFVSYRCTKCQTLLLRLYLDGPRFSQRKLTDAEEGVRR